LFALCSCGRVSLGLRWAPIQGWRIWIRWSLIIGLLVGFAITIGAGLILATAREIPIITLSPRQLPGRILTVCVSAPLQEETLYRVIVCVPVVASFGKWPAVAVSRVLFGALHFLHGNPSPENLVGGWFIAWAYLKSETVVIPLLLHNVGNLLVLLGQLATWYFLITVR